MLCTFYFFRKPEISNICDGTNKCVIGNEFGGFTGCGKDTVLHIKYNCGKSTG